MDGTAGAGRLPGIPLLAVALVSALVSWAGDSPAPAPVLRWR